MNINSKIIQPLSQPSTQPYTNILQLQPTLPQSNKLIDTECSTDELDIVKTKINNIKKSITDLEKYFKKLEKKNLELQTKLSKQNNNTQSNINTNNKRKRKSTQISEISTPIKISNELCDFINVPYDSKVSRTNITRSIINYIKTNKLSKQNIIYPDEKLSKLLNNNNNITTKHTQHNHLLQQPSHNSPITFYNIQTLLAKHFI